MKYKYFKAFGESYDFEIVYSHIFSSYGHYKIVFDCYCINNKDLNFNFSIITTNISAIDTIKDLIYEGQDYDIIQKTYHANFFDNWLFSTIANNHIELNYLKS